MKEFLRKMQYIKQNLKDIGNLNRLICREDIEKLDNKVLPFSNFTPKDLIYSMVTILKNICILYLKVAKGIYLNKFSLQEKNNCNYMQW